MNNQLHIMVTLLLAKEAQGTLRMEIWVGPRINVDVPVKSNIPTMNGTVTVQHVSIHIADSVILVHKQK
jgi:hypothetical protein